MPTPTSRAPLGKRCYVIGDIHGRLDLLNEVFRRIEEDNAARDRKETSIVLLGDLIDRGPDSRGVLERVVRNPPAFASLHAIKGNHEEVLVRGIRGEHALLPAWLAHGGGPFLQSFGVAPAPFAGASGAAIARVLEDVVPPEFVAFMERAYDYIQFGDYLMVHAGLVPGLPLERQGRHLRWVRSGFLESDHDFGVVVVHGHTIEPDIVERPNRIGLDTGAYRSGMLSALRLEDRERGRIRVSLPLDWAPHG